MAKKCTDLLHLHCPITRGSKSKRLINSSSSYKRLVIPKPNSVSHRRIPLREKILKLVSLEVIRNGQITAIYGWPFTFPTFITIFLPFNNFHHFRRDRWLVGHNHRCHDQQSKNNFTYWHLCWNANWYSWSWSTPTALCRSEGWKH